MKIIKPTLILDKEKAVKNIKRMLEKVSKSNHIRFRPHFKTHQSAQVGEWFREMGVTAIAVSSVDMASYFARNGWDDITIAILVNPLEIDTINRLAETVNLNLLVDSLEMTMFLDRHLKKKIKLWVKVDTAYHRTGMEYDRIDDILSLIKEIKKSRVLDFQGLLTHSGHSYYARAAEELTQLYDDTVKKMNDVREYLGAKGISDVEISIGDTPTCSVVDEFYGVDEVRCGNFVFYDVMQLSIGSCKEEDIAAALACPVIGRYPQRSEIVIYGGGVHLSKEFITNEKGQKIFGLVALANDDFRGWGQTIKNTYVASLSQEHGIIKTTHEFIRQVNIGDILMILPVHSCLTVNLMKHASGGQGLFLKKPPLHPAKTFY
jgi:D-serine deaminase-like pyridoxal phosphate-dependent protein